MSKPEKDKIYYTVRVRGAKPIVKGPDGTHRTTSISDDDHIITIGHFLSIKRIFNPPRKKRDEK